MEEEGDAKEDAAMACWPPAASRAIFPSLAADSIRPRAGVSIHTYTAGGGDGDGISLSGGGVPGKQPTDPQPASRL